MSAMSEKWSRPVAALVMTAAVLVAGSAAASAAPTQDRSAFGGNKNLRPAGVRRVLSIVGPAVAFLLVSGRVGDWLPAFDRLGLVRGATREAEVDFFSCEGEQGEGVMGDGCGGA